MAERESDSTEHDTPSRTGSLQRGNQRPSSHRMQGRVRQPAKAVRGKVMAKKVSPAMDINKSLSMVVLGISLLMNIGTIGYVYGGMSYRIANSEDRLKDLEKKSTDVGAVQTDIAVVKTQLLSINSTLSRLEQFLDRRPPPGK